MNRLHLAGALLSLVTIATSSAHADSGRPVVRDGVSGREHRLPLCYGNNFQVDTMLRPTGFHSLECRPVGFGRTSCDWWITSSGTRPTHDYLVQSRLPPPPTTPPPWPRPPTSIVAAAGPAVPPARLSWPTGTVIPAFVFSRCSPAWGADHDQPAGASLRASTSVVDVGLVFSLDAGRSGDAPTHVTARASIGSCAGTLALQDDAGSGAWRDVASADIAGSPRREYAVEADAPAGSRVRLVLRGTGTCSVGSADVFVET